MFIIHTSQLIQPFRKIFMDLLIKLFSKSLVRCFVAHPPSIAPRTLIRCAYTFEWQTQENKMEMQMKSRFLIPSKQTEFRSFFVCVTVSLTSFEYLCYFQSCVKCRIRHCRVQLPWCANSFLVFTSHVQVYRI